LINDDCRDHPVNIGDWDCLVESCSETELTCRTTKRIEAGEEITDDETSDLIVFLRVSEEAKMIGGTTQFRYEAASTPTVDSVSVEYQDGIYKVVFVGSGFEYSATPAKVFFD